MPGPIRNDNRDPARDKYAVPGTQLPTPNIADLVIVRTATKTKGQRWRFPHGTPDEEFNGLNGNTLARLVRQSRKAGDNNDFVATYVFATDRVDQDAYNAAISYTAQSGAHKILQRSSLELRETYMPLPDLTPDSQVPSALCTQEQASQAEDIYGTLYYRVTRVFEDFGTREQQDAWNRRDSYPYLLATYPRLTRIYRFPATYDPGFVIGETTDTEVPSATLITLLRQDESARVRTYTAVFDDIPSVDVQAGVGINPVTGIVALGVSVSYPEAPAFPVLSWAFRQLKGEYVAPTGVNAACPIPGYTSLVQTNESAAPSPDEPSVLIVTREYQKLPGAIVTSPDAKRLPRALTAIPGTYLNGDTIIKTEQKEMPGTQPDALVNGILSSAVDATSNWYSTKTNFVRASQTYPVLYLPRQLDEYGGAQGIEKKQIIEVATEDLLDHAVDVTIVGLFDDNTAFQVISYNVTALSPTASELAYTVVPAFPELEGAEYGSNVPERFLAKFNLETDQDWIDTTDTPASEQLVTDAQVVSCKITPLTPARAKRVTTRLPAGSVLPTLTGQTYDKVLRLPRPYTEDVLSVAEAEAAANNPGTEITPIDGVIAVRRVVAPISTALLAFHEFYARTITVRRDEFPAVLVSIHVEESGSDGEGKGTETGSASEFGGGTLALQTPTSAESSAAVVLTMVPVIQEFDGIKIPGEDHLIFVPTNTGHDAILTKLTAILGTTVHPWPIWQKVRHTFTSRNVKVSLRATARATYSVHFKADGRADAQGDTQGTSYSQDVSLTSDTITLPPVINQAITLTGATSVYRTATAEAHSNIATYSRANIVLTKQAGAMITPTTVPATPGTNMIPTTGLYALEVQSSPDENGVTKVMVTVVDMSKLGITPATAGTPTAEPVHVISYALDGGFIAPVSTPPADGGSPPVSDDPTTVAPAITTQPQSQTANAGDTVTLSVAATGTYPLTYQWMKDGTIIDNATGSTLILTAFDPATDSGDYSVLVVNDISGVTSAVAHLAQTGSVITITQQPASQNVASGSSVTLSVVATGGTFTYQWRKDGGEIDGANSSSYTISNATSDSAGSYDVVISSDLTTTTSSAATITVSPAPVVTVDPMDSTMNDAGAISLTATGYGVAYVVGGVNEGLNAIWYRNGVMIYPVDYVTSTNVPSTVDGLAMGTTTTTIVIGSTFVGTAGTYFVRFKDGYGNTVNSATITVSRDPTTDAPTITAQPATAVVLYNPRGGYAPSGYTTFPYFNVPFTVAATGDTPLFYHWQSTVSPFNYFDITPTTQVSVNGTGASQQSFNCVVLQEGGQTISNTVLLKTYFFEFNSPGLPPSYTTVSASGGTTVPVQMNFYTPQGGGNPPGVPFTITLSQICTDGTTAHGTFSVSTFTSVTHATGLYFLTPISNYTPSALDAGKDVKITATLAFSGGPVTGTIGNVSTIIHVTT